MIIKRTMGDHIFDCMNYILLLILSIMALYPILYMAFASLSNYSQLAVFKGLLLKPLGFNLSAYATVFRNDMIVTSYKNTVVYVVTGTAINLLMTSIGAYVLSRKRFYWKNILITIIMITMFFNGGLIPTFLVVKNLNMINSMWALIIPTAISTWNLMIMKTSFGAIPESLEESAKIDGANDWTVLFKIVIPISMPIISVMILFYMVAHWNSWFPAMIYLQKRKMFPLQLILREILIVNSADTSGAASYGDSESIQETIKYAVIMVATMPMLFIYPILQKYFVKGVMIGAIKG